MHSIRGVVAIVVTGLVLGGCVEAPSPSELSELELAPQFSHNSAANPEKGHIDGWLDGEDVRLHYTKWYFCSEPPSSGAPTGCEFGAEPEVAPRPGGHFPVIIGIAPVGFIPDLGTLACKPGSVCLNHPAMIDVSRIIGPAGTSVAPLPHSHIMSERRGGWHLALNVRVFHPDVWNEIAAAKSLAKLRELQADPNVGGAGLISPDTPTNIYFFLQVHTVPEN